MLEQQEKDEEGMEGDGDFTIDEKAKQIHLTERGQVRIEELFKEHGILGETNLCMRLRIFRYCTC